MDCANDEGSPPPELALYWMCQRYGGLPDAGGVLDQDYRTMKLISVVANTYTAIQHWITYGGKRIHELSDHDRKILRSLKDMGMMF